MPATYTPFLLTALLAKATDPSVDVLSLAVGSTARGYSARSLAADVVVPISREVGIDLRTNGPEPLNNSPFYGCARVDAMDRSRNPEAFNYLLETAEKIALLDASGAARALAAAVRVGMKDFDGEVVPLVGKARGMAQLVRAVEEFLSEKPEGGKRAQAAVAAALSCVFKRVETGLVNDPSRQTTGDVVVYGRGNNAVLAVEVRAKHVDLDDAELFRSRLAAEGIEKALICALAARQEAFEYDAIVDLSTGEEAPTLQVMTSATEMLTAAVTWSSLSAGDFAAAFPRHMAERLFEVGAPRATVSRWARITYDFGDE